MGFESRFISPVPIGVGWVRLKNWLLIVWFSGVLVG